MAFVEKISRQPTIDRIMWLLDIILMRYNEKEQTQQREIQKYRVWDKITARKCSESESSAQGGEQFQEKSDVIWRKGSGDSNS